MQNGPPSANAERTVRNTNGGTQAFAADSVTTRT